MGGRLDADADRAVGGDCIIAVGFVADSAHEETDFPSVGAKSSMPAFQAVYWRCIAAAMYGARMRHPAARLVLFANCTPPRIDGIALAELFDRLRVEHVTMHLTHRLPASRVSSWGNVFYFLDILDWLEREGDARLLLMDSDVLVTGSLQPLFDRLRTHAVAVYDVGTPEAENVNGLDRPAMTEIAADWAAARGGALTMAGAVPHLGGELLGVAGNALPRWLPEARRFWAAMAKDGTQPARVLTEEHLWSVLFPAIDLPRADTADLVKRLWTDPRHRTVAPGDEALPLWHLPAEKRYGLHDLFAWCAARDFDPAVGHAAYRAAAARLCGIPRIGLAKQLRDGARRLRRHFN